MLLLLFIIVLLMIASVPRWPYSRQWGYGPSGGWAALFIILLIIVMLGNHRIHL